MRKGYQYLLNSSLSIIKKKHYSTLHINHAQVVICGAGVVGNSIAYHLTKDGWRDVVVLEQNRIGSGTSMFGSGVLGLFRTSAERWVVRQSLLIIEQLQKEGHDLGLKNCGSVNLAQSKDRALALKRRLANVKPSGLRCEWLDRKEIGNRFPFIHCNDLQGAVYVEEDSLADIKSICSTLADLAKKQGATYIQGRVVLGVESKAESRKQVPRVSVVNTSEGQIKCEYFVNASGMWARQLGLKSEPSVCIPAFPAAHYFLRSETVSEANDQVPIIRDYDGHCFCLVRKNKFIIGGFEPIAKPVFERGVPEKWREELPIGGENFQLIKDNAEHRIPVLSKFKYEPLLHAPDNFTPDGKWILGETPEIDNYFVAVGMNGNSVQGGVGAGLAVAHWIMYGTSPSDMLLFDVRRFSDLYNNRRFLKERIKEVVGRHYEVEYPGQNEFKYARKLRCSPIYSELEAEGAVFGERMLFERPQYFDINRPRGQPSPIIYPVNFGKPDFFEFIRAEYYACREGVGILDLSSFTKIEIKSAGNTVVEFMQKLCSNDVNVPVGGVIHTGMHNERGGYENDCMLVRQTENSYFMLAATIQQTRIMDWMRRHVTANAPVSIVDVTSMYSILTVVGPKSKDVLSALTNSDLDFHGYVAKTINVAFASGILILSYTHMGEPGYTMVIPSEYTIHIYKMLKKVGENYGLCNVGMITMRALRVEKFIPFWAEDLDSTVNPYEVGRADRVKLSKNYFIGKVALQQEQRAGVKRRLVHFTMEDYDEETCVWPWRNEPIYRNGHYVGIVTSSAYGLTLGKMVCLGWVSHHAGMVVTPEYVMGDAKYEIDLSGMMVSAKPSLQPPNISVAKMQGAAIYKPKMRDILIHK